MRPAIFGGVRLPEPGPNVPRRGGRLLGAIGRSLLALARWRVEGTLPDLPRFVIIAAPHSSNWDFVLGVLVLFALRLDVRWIGKREIFRWPLGPFMHRLGGIPVDRDNPRGAVEDLVQLVAGRERFVIALAPEGTRKRVERWKTGFYRIATGAGIPIVPAYFDYARRAIGFGPLFEPTGDVERDVAALRRFYAEIPRS